MTLALATQGLSKHYRMGEGVVRALDGVSVSIEAGEFVGLFGTSGSGKSTLLNLIAGLDRPTEGSLEVFGRSLTAMSREQLTLHRRKNVGMIFQSFNLIPTMSAAQNVALALMFGGVPRKERDGCAKELLVSVGLGDRMMHRPSELSGGEQQRVSIARALANNPEILLADEPTGNLDSRTASETIALLADLNRRCHKTVVVVTHDPKLVAHCIHRSLTLVDGRIQAAA
jgi:putative ABC transport system ATP-binding protein